MIIKKKIGNLDKCYSLALLNYHNTSHILVAAEKVNKCLMFSMDGQLEETIWEQPGGAMSMVQVPGSDGQFLATHKFYSPNDAKEAKIVIVTPKGKDDWEIRTLVDLPFVHRFDIISRDGVNYLIACTLKSGHQFKDDWSMPGKVFAAVLPEDLSSFNKENQLKLDMICADIPKNHGYYKYINQGSEKALIFCEKGAFLLTPPDSINIRWDVEQLIDIPVSDGVLIDLDGCGEPELFVLSPFHGDTISIYKKDKDRYRMVYQYPEKLEFLHALFGGDIGGVPTVIVGHRKGERKLVAFRSDKKGDYKGYLLDKNGGAANILHYKKGGTDVVIAANREINEIAMYYIDGME